MLPSVQFSGGSTKQEKQKLELGGTTDGAAAGSSQQSKEKVLSKPPCPPAAPHAPVGVTQTCHASKWAPPAPHTAGDADRMRFYLRAALRSVGRNGRNREQLFSQLPPAHCPQDGGHSPTSAHLVAWSLPQVLPVEPPGRALGEGAVRGARFPHEGLAVTALHGREWLRCCRCCCARGGCWGCPGEGEEEAAESERGEAAWPCLIREICASWAHARLPLGRKLGGPENQREKSRGVMVMVTVVSCSLHPAQMDTEPSHSVTLAGMVLAELCSPAETSLC